MAFLLDELTDLYLEKRVVRILPSGCARIFTFRRFLLLLSISKFPFPLDRKWDWQNSLRLWVILENSLFDI